MFNFDTIPCHTIYDYFTLSILLYIYTHFTIFLCIYKYNNNYILYTRTQIFRSTQYYFTLPLLMTFIMCFLK